MKRADEYMHHVLHIFTENIFGNLNFINIEIIDGNQCGSQLNNFDISYVIRHNCIR